MNINEGTLLINYASEDAHRRNLPSGIGFGLMLAYQEKVEEAADFVAANYPKKISGFPMIQSTAKATGKTAREVADNIITEKAKWIKVAAKIDGYRLEAIAQLEKANADIDSIVKRATRSIDKIR